MNGTTNDLEQRLREAFQARAASVSPGMLREDGMSDLRPASPNPPETLPVGLHPAPREMRRRAPVFLAAAAILVLAAGIVAAIRFTGGSPNPPAHPSPRPSVTPTQHVLPRSAVPWNQVGSGWVIVSRTSTENGPVTVELVAPDGLTYRIVTLPDQLQPALWSPDHQRLLVTGGAHVEELTLRTGTLRIVPIPAQVQPVSYTRPTGTALLVVNANGQPTSLTRYDLATGAQQQVYPDSAAGVGALTVDQPLYDDDGGMLALPAQHGLAVLANDGQLVHAIPAPAGTTTCNPTRWDGTSAIEAACIADSGNAAANVWRFPLGGVAGAVQLTHGPNGTSMFGYQDIWSYSGGRLGLAPNGCGPSTLVRFDASGVGTEVDVPAPPGVRGAFQYVGHSGDAVLLVGHATGQCEASGFTLLSYDASTNTTAEIAPSVNSDGRLLQNPVVLPQDR